MKGSVAFLLTLLLFNAFAVVVFTPMMQQLGGAGGPSELQASSGDAGDLCINALSFFEVCLGSLGTLDLFNPLLFGGVAVTVGLAVIATGYVTGGASRGAVAYLGFSLLVGGVVVALLLAIKPVFDAMFGWAPLIGVVAWSVYAGIGLVFLAVDGLQMLGGSGGGSE